jgi:DNA replicative helicase MCM subunit Mcm2 (Cdc46/Mcm family)
MWKLDVLMSSKSSIDIFRIITRYEILQVAPGDVVEMSGIFLPMPYFGFRAMRAGLVADTYLEAMSITHFKKKYEE